MCWAGVSCWSLWNKYSLRLMYGCLITGCHFVRAQEIIHYVNYYSFTCTCLYTDTVWITVIASLRSGTKWKRWLINHQLFLTEACLYVMSSCWLQAQKYKWKCAQYQIQLCWHHDIPHVTFWEKVLIVDFLNLYFIPRLIFATFTFAFSIITVRFWST